MGRPAGLHAPICHYSAALNESGLVLLEYFPTDTIRSLCTNDDACMATRPCFELAPADQQIHQLLRQNSFFPNSPA